jgi:aquaglyceroporin related protein
MLGVYASGISGAHINPAVTFANCVFRKFPWKKFPGYALAQILGAMCASGVVYANYKSAIDVFEGGVGIRTVPGYSANASAGIFCTYPAEFLTKTGQFFSEFIASALLMFMIYALKDDGNIGAGPLTPLGLFFVIFGIGACFGWETGYAINLARDFGPRLMSYFLGECPTNSELDCKMNHLCWRLELEKGYGHNVWAAGNYYFWVSIASDQNKAPRSTPHSVPNPQPQVPMVAPFFGCTFGGFLYDALLFTGESPVNTPYMGLYRLIPSMRAKYDGVKWDPETMKMEQSSPVW